MSDLSTMLDALGLPNVSPEPEVASAMIASVHCKSLAFTIAALINEHEPLLKAEADHATVTVRERGGPAAMQFTVTSRDGGTANNCPPQHS